MPHTIEENARTVLLPAFDGLALSDEVLRFLDEGGISILIGESRDEYVARSMSPERRQIERADDFLRLTEAARSRSGRLFAAVDQEMAGICRLHDLVPAFPLAHALPTPDLDELETACMEVARHALAMGVNLFLSPVLDTLCGDNPWLKGRTLSAEPNTVATLAAAYIRGVRAAGVATCAKHFPGFASTTGDPAIDSDVVCDASRDTIEVGLEPFRAAIASGTDMMMIGPAPVMALDPKNAALRSSKVIDMLRSELGFEGVIMADDLDGKATLRGASVELVAVEALKAGCDYLLLTDTGNQVGDVAKAIVAAVKEGKLKEQRLVESANKVRTSAGASRA